MESTTNILELLDQIPQPVFLVKDAVITHVNHAAQMRQLRVNTPVAELISIGSQEYNELTDGKLLLTLTVDNVMYNASVSKSQGYDIFCMESEFQEPELRALALAAQNLREPLSNAMMGMDNLLPKAASEGSSELLEQVWQLNKTLYQMHRVIGNMSDAALYRSGCTAKMETRDATALISEMVEKVAHLVSEAGYKIAYYPLTQSVFCQLDVEKLERGLLNMISNAIRHTPTDREIHISLRLGVKKLYLSVQNGGIHQDNIPSDLFARYLREPGLDHAQGGVGLGLTIVRGAAAAHNGTVLIDQPDGQGLRFTMSVSLEQSGKVTLRSPIQLPIDYGGGYDRALIELADILPNHLFE